jgi:hypothetical protein
VIKLRYDLLEGADFDHEDLTENEFFDFYDGLFPLREGCRISTANLLKDMDSHRFCFLSEDTSNQLLPSVVRITPFLHERRIYLRNHSANKRYFITAMDMPIKDRDEHNKELFDQIVNSGDDK